MLDTIRARVAAANAASGPKYQVLRDAILDAITSGEWPAGMQLPTEAKLSKLLPYSLGTIQKAYGQLVKEGLVVRSRGRGSFVAPAQRQMSEPWHCRFLGDDGTVLPVFPHFIGQRRVRPEKRWSELFGARARVVRIDRLISINHEFEVLSRFFVPEIDRQAAARPAAQECRDGEFQGDPAARVRLADFAHRADDRAPFAVGDQGARLAAASRSRGNRLYGRRRGCLLPGNLHPVGAAQAAV